MLKLVLKGMYVAHGHGNNFKVLRHPSWADDKISAPLKSREFLTTGFVDAAAKRAEKQCANESAFITYTESKTSILGKKKKKEDNCSLVD